MSNNANVFKMISLAVFLFLFGGILLFLQSESLHLFKLKDSPSSSDIITPQSSLTPEEIKNMEQDKFLLIYDPGEESSVALKNNVEMTLSYMKKKHESVPSAKIPKDSQQYQTIMILFSDLESVKDFDNLTEYVFQGGKLFFAVRPDISQTFREIHGLIGINESEPSYKDTKMIRLESDLLINSKDLTFKDKDGLSDYVLDISLNGNSTLLATTDRATPYLWSTPYGSGTFMVFNGTMLENKMNRGFIAGALSYLNEDFIYPIINSKVVYIDDFPAPFPEGTHELIEGDYKTNTASFFHKVWWPDMLRMANKFDVKYTAGIIENYNNDVDGPFNERLSEENLKLFGRELINKGGELAVHGYNHQSLTLDQQQVESLGYTAWKSEEDMSASLRELNQFVQEIFPGYTLKTYIPPSNVLSIEGKKAIKQAIPSVSNIASLHYDDEEGISYVQEFEYSAEYNEIPRLTSDYHYTDEVQWTIANGAALYGAFSHFIHPDDILDVHRSENKGWPELSSGFSRMLKDVHERYPWMKSHTASESAESLKRFQDAQVYFSHDDNTIQGYINHFQGELDFILRSDKKVVDSTGCDVKKISSEYYLVRAASAKMTIELGD